MQLTLDRVGNEKSTKIQSGASGRLQRRLFRLTPPLNQGHGGRPPHWRRFIDHIEEYMAYVMAFDKHCKMIIVALPDPFIRYKMSF